MVGLLNGGSFTLGPGGGAVKPAHPANRRRAMLRNVFPLVRRGPPARIGGRLPIRISHMPLRRFGPVLMLLSLVACGGGDDAPPTLPPPSSAPPQSSQNPCVAALAQASAAGMTSTAPVAADVLDKGPRGLAADQRPVAELLWRSALAARATNRAAPAPDAVSQDIGDIAVIEDDGTLLLPRNSFDVRSTGLRFERNGSGGYDVTQTTAAFRTALGSRAHPLGRRLEEPDDPVCVPVLRPLVHFGVHQLRRQPDLRGGRRAVDDPRLRAAPRRAAAGGAVLRRSRIPRPAAGSSSTRRPTRSP